MPSSFVESLSRATVRSSRSKGGGKGGFTGRVALVVDADVETLGLMVLVVGPESLGG